MTGKKKQISKAQLSYGLVLALAIMVSVSNELPMFVLVKAFSVVSTQSYASTKLFLQQKGNTEQYKRSHQSPASTLFAEDRSRDINVEVSEAESKNAINGGRKQQFNEFQRAFAGLALSMTIATTTITGYPLVANAGFGPSSGATTTPPPNLNSIKSTATKITTEGADMADFNIDLDGKKLRILIDSALNVRRLEEFSGQLDDLIANLRDSVTSLASGDESEYEAPKYDAENNYIQTQREIERARNAEREKELIKAQDLRLQIERQEKALKKLQSQPYWFNYFAAFVGSTVSTLIMHPIDTIKTRMQVGLEEEEDEDEDEEDIPWQGQTIQGSLEQPGNKSGGVAVLDMAATTTTTTATTAKETAVATANTSTMAQIGSIGDLYEGLTGNLFKEVPPSAIYLGVYETVKYALSPKVAPAYLLWVYLVAGAAGETVGSVIRAPAEAVKSLVQSKAKDNALEAVKSVLGTPEGRLNVIRAWSASIGRDVPFGAIQLAAFETIKAFILNNPNIEIDSSTLLSEAVIGAFAGGLGAFVTNPTDVITTRIITQDTTGGTGDGINGDDDEGDAPLGVIDMGKKIYREEGIEAFFTGWTARVGYWAPAISIFLTCYCSVRRAGIDYDLFL